MRILPNIQNVFPVIKHCCIVIAIVPTAEKEKNAYVN